MKNLIFVYLFAIHLTVTDEWSCFDEELICQQPWSNCTHPVFFCNGAIDCSDGFDEIRYNETIHTAEDGIPCHSRFHRGEPCLLPADQAYKNQTICRPDESCLAGDFECTDGSKCMPAEGFCNDVFWIPKCKDRSGNIIYNRTLHSTKEGFKCVGAYRTCVLPHKYVCDGTVHCHGYGGDEIFCDSYIIGDFFLCFDWSQAIAIDQVCDGIFHCQDLSDECLCTSTPNIQAVEICSQVKWNEYPYVGKFSCKNHTSSANLTVENICDERIDCAGNGEDEMFCEEYLDCVGISADPSSRRCNYECEGQELSKTATRCDGRFECNFLEEECENCENPHPACRHKDLLSTGLTLRCSYDNSFGRPGGTQICDGATDCPTGVDEQLCPYRSCRPTCCSALFAIQGVVDADMRGMMAIFWGRKSNAVNPRQDI